MTPGLRHDLGRFVELLAPLACAGCSRDGIRWCPDCADVLTGTAPRRWSPTPAPPGIPPVWSGPAYAGPVRAAVVAWKDGGRRDLTEVFAPVLRGVVLAAAQGSGPHRQALAAGRAPVLVPAPSAARATRRRGEHLLSVLARRAAPPGYPVLPVLRVRRTVADQAGLGAAQRRSNLDGAVTVGRGVGALTGVPCILLDDVVTTGATLTEAARALRTAGSGPVLGVTLAATARSSGPPVVPLSEPGGGG